jgi:hypothetical protein
MRKKGKYRKDKKILIRVDQIEKELAEELSQTEGKNTSEFFRSILHEYNGNKQLELQLKLTEKNRALARELKEALVMAKRKGRG